ncbi:MAG: hypothetical protein HUJ71_06070, partial [Pseudobutyrivibrio sp.]|nr:hypothetical protein [Pseudobutyrivibrio sp.]
TDVVSKTCRSMVDDGLDHPTVFEVETAIAFLYFIQEKVDIVILETGMGGAEDATNVVQKPLATVFVSISYDHMGFLGDTIEEIARCKAGIMREGVPVICANMPVVESMGKMACAFETLAMEAKKNNAPLYDANEYDVPENINIPLAGGFQRDNMTAALLTYDVLKEVLPGERAEYIAGLESTKWPGRYETISNNPRIIRDGAHNPDAVKRLREAVEMDDNIQDKVHLIMGVYADKDYDEEIKIIAPIAKSFTAITSPNRERALDGRILAKTAAGLLTDIPVSYQDSLKEAIDATCASREDTILIFGSLSLAILTEEITNSGFPDTPERK